MRVRLAGSTRHRIPTAQPTGEAPAGEFPITVMVRPKSPLPPLQTHAAQKPREREYLSREEHAAHHGAALEDLRKVSDFARANGLRVIESDAAKRHVILSGTADAYRRAFDVELQNYRHNGRTFRGREGDIMIPEELQGIITSVTGLDNRPVARPHFRVIRDVARAAGAASSATVEAVAPAFPGRVEDWRGGRTTPFPVPGRVEDWRGGLTTPFPVPATSNGACGFPALRSPAHFGARVMRRRPVGPLSSRVLVRPVYSTFSHRFPLHLAL